MQPNFRRDVRPGVEPRLEVKGWGVDAKSGSRPGVPAEIDPPRPMGSPSYGTPAQQVSDVPPAVGALRPITPVYSTAIPGRGLSGWIRKRAYAIPDYRARRWLLLLTADRVDAVEHGHSPRTVALTLLATLGLAWLGVRSARRWRD